MHNSTPLLHPRPKYWVLQNILHKTQTEQTFWSTQNFPGLRSKGTSKYPSRWNAKHRSFVFNRRQNLDWINGIRWMLWRVISLTRLAFSQLIRWYKMLGSWESFFPERLMTKPCYILVNHHVLVWNQDITDLCSPGCCCKEFHLASAADGLVKRREGSLSATTHFTPGFPYIPEHNSPSASQRTQQQARRIDFP